MRGIRTASHWRNLVTNSRELHSSQPVLGFTGQKLLITCIDPRINELASTLFPDSYTVRYAGGAVPEASELTKLAIGNTTRVLASLKKVAVMMHNDCAMVKAVRNKTEGLSAPVLKSSFHELGHDSAEEKVAIESLIKSVKNLKEAGVTGSIFPLYYDLHEGKIKLLQGDELVVLKKNTISQKDEGMLPSISRIVKFNNGITLDEIYRQEKHPVRGRT